MSEAAVKAAAVWQSRCEELSQINNRLQEMNVELRAIIKERDLSLAEMEQLLLSKDYRRCWRKDA